MMFTRKLLRPAAAVLVASVMTSAALVVATARGDDVTTTAGKKISGKLVGVDAKGITFVTQQAQVDIPGRDLVVVDFGNKILPPPATYSEIELTDGSLLRMNRFVIKDKTFECEPLPSPHEVKAPTFDIPIRTVFTAIKKAHDPKITAAWKKMLATRGKRDLYVLERETDLTYVQGTIESASADGRELKFQNESGDRTDTLLQSRAAGYVFAQPQPTQLPPTICRVHDVYGNILNATAITLGTDESVTVVTVAGAKIHYPSIRALVRLDYAQGNVTYLSDLDPKVEAAELPADELKLNVTVPYLKDRSLANEAIKLDNTVFPKGLCIAPDTVLTFDLTSDYSQLKAMAGIDENGANATSSAKLTIEGDGQILFSATLNRQERAKPIVLAITGIKQLRVIVEADTPFNGNYVTLADARVQK